MATRIHETAEVARNVQIGDGTSIWNNAQVRDGAVIGSNCIIGKNVYIDAGVVIGSNVKIQNNVSVFHGVVIEDGVFVGPHACFTNDLSPRAINPNGTLKLATDWVVTKTLIQYGAAIGANATIVCGVTIGRWALIGAGSVVTHDVQDHGLVYGNPAQMKGLVCSCGNKLVPDDARQSFVCPACGLCYTPPSGIPA